MRAIERAAAAPFITAPRTQWWYPVLMACFFTAMMAGAPLVGRGHAAVGFGLQVLALVAVGVFYGTYRETWGTRPRMRSAPPEIAAVYRWCWGAFAGAMLLSAAVWVLSDWRVGLSSIFVTTLAVTWAYERRVYPRAAQQVRERLA
ncbi:MAG: hypothetical protein LH477_13990 [Nocardioides sp.]|nr:hypothetical protein [Nocardioides sp.]